MALIAVKLLRRVSDFLTSKRFWPSYSSVFGVVTVILAVLAPGLYLSALGILLLPLVAWLGVLARERFARRRWVTRAGAPVVYSRVDFEWQFKENGDFSSTSIYTVENVSGRPIVDLPADDFLWNVEPHDVRMRVRILDDGGKLHSVSEYDNSIYRRVLAYLTRGESYFISFSHRILPALAPGESMRFEMQIETPGTEMEAFTDQGTTLGIPANVPTRRANLTCVGPAGYKFELLKPRWVVNSETGENVPEEEERIDPPCLSPARTTLTWQLDNLKQGLRYWVQYRFRRECMQEVVPTVRDAGARGPV